MTRILRFSRTAPALVRMGQAHLSGVAPALNDRPRVTREELSSLFSVELGYSRRPAGQTL